MGDATQEMENALEVVFKIERKIDDLFAPLETEMRIMQWRPEYQAIIWEAVAMRATQLARLANEAQSDAG